MDKPIITSLLDIDLYKFTMGQWIHHHPYLYDKVVTSSFVNRSKKIQLINLIDIGELRENLEHVRSLRFSHSSLHYLRSINTSENKPLFTHSYLSFLKDMKMCDFQLYYDYRHSTIQLSFEGDWQVQTYWETLAMSIINELYIKSHFTNNFQQDYIFADATVKLKNKIKTISSNPEITFIDFGTRRRASKSWQKRVCEYMVENLPNQFLGTSNVQIAQELNIQPKGTNAHEIPMVVAAFAEHSNPKFITNALRDSLISWADMYPTLKIALTDTYGTKWFYENCGDIIESWDGVRQDSGDPIDFATKTVAFYKSRNIDPATKTIVFSDGLDAEEIFLLKKVCNALGIKCTFGWGTNLTCDTPIQPISIVVKATHVENRPTVKLSDNIAKAIGPTWLIDSYKEYFSYSNSFNKDCRS